MASLVRSRRPPPLDQESPPSSAALPGAWLSTWSLSEMTPVNKNFRPNVKKDLALHKSTPSDSSGATMSVGSRNEGDGLESPRVSIEDDIDAESTWSGDYYSVASDVEMDEGCPTSDIEATDHTGMEDMEAHDASSILEQEVLSPTSSGSFEAPTSTRTTPEDYASSVGEASGSKASAGSPSTGSLSTPPRPMTRLFLRPPSQIDLASPRTSVVSTDTKDTDYSNASSSVSGAYGDDDASECYSENPVLDEYDDDDDDDNSIFHLGHGDSGCARVATPIATASHPCRRSPIGRLSALERVKTPRKVDSDLDFRSLAQPDGSDPWTLGLDPTLNSITGLDSTCTSSSRSSTHSLSVTSSSEVHEQINDRELEQIEPRPIEEPLRNSVDEPTPGPIFPVEEEITVRQTIDLPSTVVPSTLARPSTSSAGRPPSTLIQKKASKTKRFYMKVKKFFSPKTTQPISSKGIANDPYQPTNNVDFPTIPDTPPIAADMPPMPSSTQQFTVYRRTLFGRTRNASSATSIAHSFAPGDYSTQPRLIPRSPSVVPDERYTYEYHARPKTLEEIKMDSKVRRRRISLPVGFFNGPPPSPRRAPSIHDSTNGSAVGIHRSNLGATHSISSSLHVPHQRWPHPPRSPSRIE